MQKYSFLDMASWAVSAFGAMYMGFRAFGYDPFRDMFRRNTMIERTLYTTFGLAGLVSMFQLFSMFRLPETMRDMFSETMHHAPQRR